MRQSKLTLFLSLCSAVALIMFSSCASMTRPVIYNTYVSKSSYSSPSDSVLVFGSLRYATTSSKSGYSLDYITYLQLNTQKEPMVLRAGELGNFFYTHPLPVGSSIKLTYFSRTVGRTIYYYPLGLQGRDAASGRLNEPGLLYLGSLRYCSQGYINSLTSSEKDLFDGPGIYPIGNETELDALKTILYEFKGTEWEKVIRERIEELQS